MNGSVAVQSVSIEGDGSIVTFKPNEQSEVTLKDLARGKVDIPWAEQWIMKSRDHRRRYQILVAKPPEAPPPAGFPVIYLLDANSVFGTMVEAVRLQSRRPDKTGIVPAVIVGIGYPVDGPFAPERFYDLTPAPAKEYLNRPDSTPLPEQGGAAQFLKFIEEELKPHIEGEFPVDRSRQTIFGHSLGGLFVLYALFAKPHAFQSYIAGSPSLHWNEPFLLEAERKFAKGWQPAANRIELLLGVGELEKTHVSRNCDRALALSERLTALSGRGLDVEYKEFEGEGHVSVLPVLISRALRLALRPKP